VVADEAAPAAITGMLLELVTPPVKMRPEP
jgi:hypothetical protein